MSLQIDGNTDLAQQELQLQTVETFFVEVIDYQATDNAKNDVTTKPSSSLQTHPLRLKVIATPADLAPAMTGVVSVVFDRKAFVSGIQQRVVGVRA